jgi:hypothetical protein
LQRRPEEVRLTIVRIPSFQIIKQRFNQCLHLIPIKGIRQKVSPTRFIPVSIGPTAKGILRIGFLNAFLTRFHPERPFPDENTLADSVAVNRFFYRTT